MKRALGAVVFSLCFFFLCYSAALAETTTTVTIGPDVKGAKGSTVTISVKVTGVPDPGIGSMKGSISYPADLLEIKESDISTADRDNYLIVAAVDNGEIGFVFACFLRRCKTNGAIFQINAKVIGEDGDEGDLKIMFDEFRTAADPPENVASVAIVNGKFTAGPGGDGGPECSGLQASFTASSPSGLTVTFDASGSSVSGSGCKIESYVWSFGDTQNNTATGQKVPHTFSRTGCFTVKLTVTDNKNNTRDFSQVVNVGATPPPADFTFSPKSNISAGDVVAFTYTPTPVSGATYSWDFGDSGKSTEQSPRHIFFKGGNFNVNLTVTNGGCSSIKSQPISVAAPKRPLVRNWPNPATTSVTFGYGFPETASSGTIKIFDMSGKLVKELPNLSKSNDKTSWTISSDIPNGPYYYVLIAGGSASKVGKFVIHR